MIVTLVNGCVLFPHKANWTTAPQCKRGWQTEISETLPGNETRQALRAVPRRSVTFVATASNLNERLRLDLRVEAATKSGYGCAPLHGRCCFLGANANADSNSVTVAADSAWNWMAGDYVILIQDDQTFDIATVTNVTGNVLTLATNLNYAWENGHVIWPVIFGKFLADKEDALDGYLAEQRFTITELVSGRSVQIGVTPIEPPGVGEQAVGSTNTIT